MKVEALVPTPTTTKTVIGSSDVRNPNNAYYKEMMGTYILRIIVSIVILLKGIKG